MFFILSKKNCIVFCLITALSGMILGGIMAISSHAGTFFSDNTFTIVIDAGHGFPDGGAVGVGGTVEQEINLSICKKLAEVLEAKGIDVIMTRTGTDGLWSSDSTTIREKKLEDMRNRLKIMKKSDADLFITVHMNSYKNSSASGLRIFYSENHKEIKPLAENIQSRMSDVTGAHTEVVKTADRKLFLLKNPPMPAILAECGFLSNPEEEKKLCDEEYQAKLAWAIADAIEKYYSMP